MTSPGRATRAARWVMIVALTAGSTACNLTPTYERPKQDLPITYRNQTPEPPPGLPKPLSKWWKVFGSEELDTLVEEALANNHDVKAAVAKIIEAENTASATAATLLPTVTSSFKRSTDSPQGGQGSDPSSTTNRTHRVWSAYTSASWEVDLWGKIRASEASSLATALANVHDREAVALALVSDVVLSYIQYLEGMDRETVALSNIANMQSMYTAVSERVRLGESSKLELAQQRNVLAQAKATIPPILLTRERAFNKLAVLLGRPPATLALSGRTLRDLAVPETSTGIPSDLLLRRPDIRKAEANLVAANANVGVARAKLFPTLSFSGDRGWAAWYLDQITKPTSIFFTIAGTVAATVFDNGKTRADIDYAEAKKVELVETYQQTILTSLRDVEDALASVRSQNDLEVAEQEVLQASLDAYGLSTEAFRLGLVDYINVLETQRTRFQAEDAKVQARFGRLEAAIGLYKALGGGVEDDDGTDGAEGTGANTGTTPDKAAAPAAPPTTTSFSATTTEPQADTLAPVMSPAAAATPQAPIAEPEAPAPSASPRPPVQSEPATAAAAKPPLPQAEAATSPKAAASADTWPPFANQAPQAEAAPAPVASDTPPLQAAPAPTTPTPTPKAPAAADTWPPFANQAPQAEAAPTAPAAAETWPPYANPAPQGEVDPAPAASGAPPLQTAPAALEGGSAPPVGPADIYRAKFDDNAS